MRLALLHGKNGVPHGRAPRPAHGFGRLGGHVHFTVGMANLTGVGQTLMRGHERGDLSLVAMKDQLHRSFAAFEKLRHAVNNDLRRIIAAHGVDG